jgi:hypothetical protein
MGASSSDLQRSLELSGELENNDADGTFVQRLLRSGPGADHHAGGLDDLAGRIELASSGGRAIDDSARDQLQKRMGVDLSAVRVHDDPEADALARGVDAIAFTTGSDIFFRSGAYRPNTHEGLRLLAHETTHVLQQAAGPVAGAPTAQGVSLSDPSDSHEQAAEAHAEEIMVWLGSGSSGPSTEGTVDTPFVSPSPASGAAVLALQRETVCDEESGECWEQEEPAPGGDDSGGGGAEWAGGGATTTEEMPSAAAPGVVGSGAGSEWAAGPGADGSSAGSQWTAGPGADGSTAGSQWAAGPGAGGTTGTDNSTTDGGIGVDKWLSDPIGQLEQLGEDVAPLMGTGQPENVQHDAGGGDTGAADAPSVTDILADPSGALDRAISVVQKAISGYGVKESAEGGLSSTERGYVAALQNAVEQLSTLRGSDDGSSIAMAVGPILGVAHYLEGGTPAPPDGHEPADGATVQRTFAILLGGVALAPIIIAGVVIIAIVAIGQWLLTRSDPPRVPPEISLDMAQAMAAIRQAIAIIGATTSAAITAEAAEEAHNKLDEAEERLKTALIGAFEAGLAFAEECKAQIFTVSRLLNKGKLMLEEPLDEIDSKELEDLLRDLGAAMEALAACMQGLPDPGGGERQPIAA